MINMQNWAVVVHHPLTLDMLERISNKERVNRNKLCDIVTSVSNSSFEIGTTTMHATRTGRGTENMNRGPNRDR
jgi:hypothetical protein